MGRLPGMKPKRKKPRFMLYKLKNNKWVYQGSFPTYQSIAEHLNIGRHTVERICAGNNVFTYRDIKIEKIVDPNFLKPKANPNRFIPVTDDVKIKIKLNNQIVIDV